MLALGDVTAARLSQDEVQKLVNLEQTLNQTHQNDSEIYVIAYEKK